MTSERPQNLQTLLEWWQSGRWSALAEAAPGELPVHDRGLFELLRSAALFQLDRYAEVGECVARARSLGCDERAVAAILVSGTYDTLGSAAALAGDDDLAVALFREAVAVAEVPGVADVDFGAHQRVFGRMSELKLLKQAAAQVESRLGAEVERSPAGRLAMADRIAILSSEIGTLKHELALAYEKNQLYGQASAGADDSRSSLRSRSPSQLGQDLWVLECTGFKRGGFFVEFGATDGILLSNTLLLEREFGWSGICVEPNPEYFQQLRTNRSCVVDDACISGTSGQEVEFILAAEYGGIAEYANSDQHAERREAYRKDARVVRLTTISLNDLLIRCDAPRDIDYVSIDTEGSEYEILSTFPLDDWNVRCFTIEHNNAPHRDSIRSLLESHGYRRTEARWDDWYER